MFLEYLFSLQIINICNNTFDCFYKFLLCSSFFRTSERYFLRHNELDMTLEFMNFRCIVTSLIQFECVEQHFLHIDTHVYKLLCIFWQKPKPSHWWEKNSHKRIWKNMHTKISIQTCLNAHIYKHRINLIKFSTKKYTKSATKRCWNI